ncbi:heterokaryon incompatibility protein [Diplodia corticola]|uniref:Heterokaryon incompatibility protein n=1 Tax=Diplodia corticola TaxID=236234 RepID=A0A1J9S978_9PEZI|nr:heterokaryon incompatibility protein [Diplodia corticola]OJD36452.1 heterokaryon incompatibility protein [Diplodia corticola]
MLPIIDPDVEAPPNHVPLFSTVRDLEDASSHNPLHSSPEEVLRATSVGDDLAKMIDVSWWPNDGPRFIDEKGKVLHNVAPSGQLSEDEESGSQETVTGNPPRQIVFCQPGEERSDLPADQITCVMSPSSFYETMVSMFAAMKKTGAVPAHMCPRMYEYTPLASGQNIRILTLWPGSGDTQLRCETREVTLGSGVYYEALSYTWGDQSTGTLISFNGLLLPIAPNLCSALLHLRLPDRPRTLWIDAVCINQLDNEEKSLQVQMMRDIYQEASSVIVWLGSTEDDSDAAMDLIAGDVTAGCDEATVPADFEFVLDDQPPFPESGRYPGEDYTPRGRTEGVESERAWTALYALVQRPWWSRAWVLQEYAVPKQEPTFRCGSQVVTAGELQQICSIAGEMVDSLPMPAIVAIRAGYRLDPLFMTRDTFQKESQLDLRHLLQYNLNTQATNLRDKVIALLGLTSQECRDALVPDYSKSITQIYAETAKYIIQSTGDLNILATNTNSDRKSSPPLPSWVPDWALFASRPPTLLQPSVYQASGPYAACIGPSSDPNVLEAGGIPIDRIAHVSDAIAPADVRIDTGALGRTVRKLYDQVLSASGSGSRTRHSDDDDDDDDDDRFWRTLVADRHQLPPGDSSSSPSPSYSSPAPAAFADLFELFLHPSPQTQAKTTTTTTTAPLTTEIAQVLATRRVFVTERGRLGVGPAGGRVGDVVAVLMGGEMPFLLREVGEEEEGEEEEEEGEGERDSGGLVRLVGEAYVHGVMRGEVVEELPGPGRGLEGCMVIFRIC